MKLTTFFKLTVVVISQLFSLAILIFGVMVTGQFSSWWIVGALITTIVFHAYLAFRVGKSSRRNGQ